MATAEWDFMSHGPIGVTAHLSRRPGLHHRLPQPTACAILSDSPPALHCSELQAARCPFSRRDEYAASVRDTRVDCNKPVPLLYGADLAHPTRWSWLQVPFNTPARLHSVNILS